MNMIRTAATAISLTWAGTLSASAQVPTLDLGSIGKLSEQLVEAKLQLQEQITQNLKLDEQTAQLLEQLRVLQQQITALTQGLSLADLGIDPDSFLEDILPDFADLTSAVTAARNGEWDSVLASGASLGGSGGGSRSVASHVDSTLESAGMSRNQVEELTSSDDPAAARIGQAANIGAFLSVAAESSSQQAKESLARIDGYVQQIPETAGLKEAIDLNTQVTAELGIALANVWSMEAIQTVGAGEMGVMDAATAADEEKYLNVSLED